MNDSDNANYTDTFDRSEWIHLSALARLIGVNPGTISRKLRRKGAPVTQRFGNKVFIRRADINNPVIRL